MINKYMIALTNIFVYSSFIIISPFGILIYWFVNNKSLWSSIKEYFYYTFIFSFFL